MHYVLHFGHKLNSFYKLDISNKVRENQEGKYGRVEWELIIILFLFVPFPKWKT